MAIPKELYDRLSADMKKYSAEEIVTALSQSENYPDIAEKISQDLNAGYKPNKILSAMLLSRKSTPQEVMAEESISSKPSIPSRLIRGAGKNISDVAGGLWSAAEQGPINFGINAAKGIRDYAIGGGAAIRESMGMKQNPYASQGQIEQGKALFEPTKQALTTAYENPRGIPSQIGNWAIDNPLSAAMTVSQVAGGVGGLAKEANLPRTMAAAKTVEELTNPITLASKPVSKLFGRSAANSARIADAEIDYRISKGVRPTTLGKGTDPQIELANQKARIAVKAIIENKNNLKFPDGQGGFVGGLPEDLTDFSRAITQTKRDVFNKYNEMFKKAGQPGVKIDLTGLADELDAIGKSVEIADNYPSIAKYAKKLAKTYRKRGAYSLEEAQNIITQKNSDLDSFYKRPDYNIAARARIDKLVADTLRDSVDNKVESVERIYNLTGRGQSFSDLKRTYGALKSIEKEVNHRRIVDLRKNTKGLIDFSDLYSGTQLIDGIVGMNPASLLKAGAVKGISYYIKGLNDPNTHIRKMFKKVDDLAKTPSRSVQVPPYPAAMAYRFGEFIPEQDNTEK